MDLNGICAEKPGGVIHCYIARENGEARASVCLTMKNVQSLNSSRNNSSVDDVPSQ